jgi:hypothetical protein
MRNALFAVALSLYASSAMAQSGTSDRPQADAKPSETRAAPINPFAGIPAARPEDVRSSDAIIAALYDVISGDAGG